MRSKLQLVLILIAVPLVGYMVSEGILRYEAGVLRNQLRELDLGLTAAQIDAISLSNICDGVAGVDAGIAAAFSEECGRMRILKLLRAGSVYSAIAGVAMLVMIGIVGWLARFSRRVLVLTFGPGLYVAVLMTIGLISSHAAIAMASIYYGEDALIGRIHVGYILLIGLGALVGVFSVGANMLTAVRRATTSVIGRVLPRDAAPLLWARVDEASRRLGALAPDHIVVGVEPNFYVTEAEVECSDRVLKGRTLFCSAPLCRILSTPELDAVIGHELGHFKGQDTEYSKRFAPIYSGTASSLEALDGDEEEGASAIALLPGRVVLGYFMHAFSIAESKHSRIREFAADKAGAAVSTPEDLAVALMKLHAFSDVWQAVTEESVNALRQGLAFPNISALFAEASVAIASNELLESVRDAQVSHPTDSHPPLSERLDALGVSMAALAPRSLSVAPENGASGLLGPLQSIEEDLSTEFQAMLTVIHGIEVPSGEESASKDVEDSTSNSRDRGEL